MTQPNIIVNLKLKNSEKSIGSAVAVTPDKVLTAKHVVISDGNEISENDIVATFFEHRSTISVKKIEHHPKRDVSLITLGQEHRKKVVQCDFESKMKESLKVQLLACNSEESCVKGPLDVQLLNWVEPNGWEFHTQPAHGMSGGAVLFNGRLVGIIQAKDESENSGIMIPLNDVKEFLFEHLNNDQAKEQANKNSDVFLSEIKKNIARILSEDNVSVFTHSLWEELNKVLASLEICSIENVPNLISEQLVIVMQCGGKKCPVINKVLTKSVERCFDKNKDKEVYGNALPHHTEILDAVEQILGYLVLCSVEENDARDVSEWLQDDLDGLYFELYIRTLGGVELFIAKHQERKPNLKLDETQDDVTGMHLIYLRTDILSWQDKARLDEVQRIIWSAVYRKDRATSLDEDEIRKLSGRISAKMASDSSEKYCLVIPFVNGSDDSYQRICKDFLSKLKIPLIQYRVDGEKEAFSGIESDLMGAIAEFLEKINKYT